MPAKALGEGLYFRIHDSGAQQFYFRYRFGDKNGKWLMLGHYPALTLAAARKQVQECRVLVNRGVDPSLERQRQKATERASVSFGDVVDEWYEREIKPRYKSPEVVARVIKNWIKPAIGSTAIREVTPMQVDRMLKAIVVSGAPTVANDALRHVQRAFRFARKRQIVDINPVADFVPSDAGGQESSRERFLDERELRSLFKAMRESTTFGRENELGVLLLLMTCARKMELLSARWADVDLDARVWTLRDDNKVSRAVAVPLSPQSITLFEELRVRACESAYVFPARRISRRKRFPHVGPDTLNRALDNLGHELAPFTVHDLRRTGRTHLSRLKVDSDIAERCLNHKVGGVKGTYDRYAYFEERSAALQRWADDIDRLRAVRSKSAAERSESPAA